MRNGQRRQFGIIFSLWALFCFVVGPALAWDCCCAANAAAKLPNSSAFYRTTATTNAIDAAMGDMPCCHKKVSAATVKTHKTHCLDKTAPHKTTVGHHCSCPPSEVSFFLPPVAEHVSVFYGVAPALQPDIFTLNVPALGRSFFTSGDESSPPNSSFFKIPGRAPPVC